MGPHLPQVRRIEWGWGSHTAQGGIDPGDHRFRSWFVSAVDRCMEGFIIRGRDLILSGWRWLHQPQPISDKSLWAWGSHTVRGDIDLGEHRFRPWFVAVVDVTMVSRSGNVNLSPPGSAECHRPQSNTYI